MQVTKIQLLLLKKNKTMIYCSLVTLYSKQIIGTVSAQNILQKKTSSFPRKY